MFEKGRVKQGGNRFHGIWKKRGRVYGTPAYYTFRLYSTGNADIPVAVESNSGHYDVHHGISRLPEIPEVPYLDVVAKSELIHFRHERTSVL